jgi:orotidine-5'-phosphate decarboxylase
MTFQAKLAGAAEANDSLLCVGLDPDPQRTPPEETITYLRAVIEATSDLVCAYKPNLAFYEQLGPAGYETLAAVIDAIPSSIPTIADAKRGDIGYTASAYARAIFDQLGFDAATVNPYLGGDAVAPFTERADKCALIVCRTSNPGARDFQDLPVADGSRHKPLFVAIAERAREWNRHGNVGLVAGATYPEDIRTLREICPEMPLLIPGVGTQKGDLGEAVRAGLDRSGAGIIVNASRAIVYASTGDDAVTNARREAERLRSEINEAARLSTRVSATRNA